MIYKFIKFTTKKDAYIKTVQLTGGNQASYQNHHLRSTALVCHHLEMTHSSLKALVKEHVRTYTLHYQGSK
jgi:hypothetical protein